MINEPKKKLYVSIFDLKNKYSIFMTNSVHVHQNYQHTQNIICIEMSLEKMHETHDMILTEDKMTVMHTCEVFLKCP